MTSPVSSGLRKPPPNVAEDRPQGRPRDEKPYKLRSTRRLTEQVVRVILSGETRSSKKWTQ